MDVRLKGYDKDGDELLEFTLTYENTKHLDGKCYLDLDRNDWLEVVRFTVDEDKGVTCRMSGTDVYGGYDHTDTEEFGTYDREDTYFGDWIQMIESGNFKHILIEIPQELYDEYLEFITNHKKLAKIEYEVFGTQIERYWKRAMALDAERDEEDSKESSINETEEIADSSDSSDSSETSSSQEDEQTEIKQLKCYLSTPAVPVHKLERSISTKMYYDICDAIVKQYQEKGYQIPGVVLFKHTSEMLEVFVERDWELTAHEIFKFCYYMIDVERELLRLTESMNLKAKFTLL